MKLARKHIVLAALLLSVATMSAQVFVLGEDEFNNSPRTPSSTGPIVPYQGGDNDQSLFTPVGSGLALLAALGGAYLVGKRRKENE